ncbi:PREDICTED: uncharacterized protein LOC109227663 [Nicotiana attenuata]|uniref:uncharacterized protein LOC109227663 n=1 Tax=Nicotiana attenuata TaxID=49451 RepID=UPI0009048D6E|nr:PREDICTED: uncharacterized protein LOC109227663 [Nicotiana attenuata]
MLSAREEFEHEILWEMNRGSTNVWHENWTGLGALYHVSPPEFHIDEELQEVADLREGDDWNVQLLEQSFPMDIANHIRQEFLFEDNDEYWDTPKWMPTASGRFTLWKGKVPTDYIWRRSGHMVVSKYWCCIQPHEDSFQHLFLTSPIADSVWRTFTQATGIVENLVQVHQIIKVWWNVDCCPKLKPLFQAAPAVIIWELWKRRNTMKYGGAASCSRMIHEVNKTLHNLARVSASRGNPGPSFYGFCVRNSAGDLVFARAEQIEDTTNIVVESKAIVEGLSFCVEQHLHPLIVETDSLVLKRIIEGEWDTPQNIGQEVKRIKGIKESHNVIFQHVLREGNTLADFSTNIDFSFAGRRLLNRDKDYIPNLRVRVAKRKAPD